LCSQHCRSLLLWCLSYPSALLHRYRHYRINDASFSHSDTPGYIGISNSLLYKHHQNYSKNPFSATEEESLFYMFYTYGCCVHFLWQLHFHVCETFCKGKSVFK
jgi:hypothetical protein